MKKALVLAITTIALCGCGKNEITTKTCSMNENNIGMTFKLTATNDEIDKVVLTMEMDSAYFGVESLDILDDEQKEAIKENMLSTLGLDSDTYEGIKINIEIKETMVVTIDADLTKADAEVLKKVGMDFTGADMSLENAVKDLTDNGATCK